MKKNLPSPAPVPASVIEEQDRLRHLLERLTYTRADTQRQLLLEQVRGEIQEIRKLAEF
jgi:nitrogen-specific signal transduction histidine kinase